MEKGNLSKLSSVATIKFKTTLSPEARETLELAQKSMKRISEMARGINGFCSKVDPGREEVYEFSRAMALIISMIQEDADLVAENVAEVLND
jgi:hypothetical protein